MPICKKVFDHKYELDSPIPYRLWPDRCECMARVQPCRHRAMIEAVSKYFWCPTHGIDFNLALSDQFKLNMSFVGVELPHISCIQCEISTDPLCAVTLGTWFSQWLGRALTYDEVMLCHEMLSGQVANNMEDLK